MNRRHALKLMAGVATGAIALPALHAMPLRYTPCVLIDGDGRTSHIDIAFTGRERAFTFDSGQHYEARPLGRPVLDGKRCELHYVGMREPSESFKAYKAYISGGGSN